MSEYTLAQAKYDCIEMWDYLRKNPDKDKLDYFGLASYHLFPIENGCALCEYTNLDCAKCPVTWVPGVKNSMAMCEQFGSPYRIWFLTECRTKRGLRVRKIAATEVLKLALGIEVEI